MYPHKGFGGDSSRVELTHIHFANRGTIALGARGLATMSSGCKLKAVADTLPLDDTSYLSLGKAISCFVMINS